MALNAKQHRFAEEYIVDLNATKAAIRAGYSAKTAHSQGPRLLEHVEIQRLIEKLKSERSERTKIDADWVLRQAVEVHNRCLQAVPVLEKVDGEMVETGEYKFDSAGANRALEIVGKHVDVQAFNERSTVDVKMSRADLMAERRRRAASAGK